VNLITIGQGNIPNNKDIDFKNLKIVLFYSNCTENISFKEYWLKVKTNDTYKLFLNNQEICYNIFGDEKIELGKKVFFKKTLSKDTILTQNFKIDLLIFDSNGRQRTTFMPEIDEKFTLLVSGKFFNNRNSQLRETLSIVLSIDKRIVFLFTKELEREFHFEKDFYLFPILQRFREKGNLIPIEIKCMTLLSGICLLDKNIKVGRLIYKK
jgi:hypothetical protein